jgi:hypothetical protein
MTDNDIREAAVDFVENLEEQHTLLTGGTISKKYRSAIVGAFRFGARWMAERNGITIRQPRSKKE